MKLLLLPFTILKWSIVLTFYIIKTCLVIPFKLLYAICSPRGKLGRMDGYQYERYVAGYLRRRGYHNVTVTKASGDYGVDVVASKHGKKYAVQCKYYSNPVGITAVQQAVAGMAMYGCNSAMVVTNSTFTAQARTLAGRNHVILLEKIGR